jgi:4-amino-4-deoxy-L-arabinose transferase-like glycosyltransferase
VDRTERPRLFGGPVGERTRTIISSHADVVAIGLIVLAAVAIRVAFAFRPPVFLLRDTVSYFLPAWDLLNGYGFDISIRRTPVYPLFLAGAMATFGEDLVAIAFAQHLLGILSAVLVYLIGQKTFGRAAGLAAGLLTALSGPLLIAEHYLMPEALLTTLLLSTLLTFLAAVGSGRRRLFALTGLLLGVSLLCKPVAQVLIPIFPLVILVSYRSLRRAIVPSALIGAGLVAVVLPWMARNVVVQSSATTAGALGQTLLARTAKHDTGFDWYNPARADSYERREGIARQIVENGVKQRLSDGVIYRRVQDRFGMTDAEVNGFMRQLATQVILEEPVYYLRGTVRMTWQLLSGEVEKLSTDWKTQNARLSRDEWDDRVEYLLSRATDAQRNELDTASAVAGFVQPAGWGLLLPILFLVGSVLTMLVPRLRPALVLSLTVFALLMASAALDGPVTRYRYPTDPLVALIGAGAVAWVAGWAVDLARRRGTATGAHPSSPTPLSRTRERGSLGDTVRP